MYIYTGTIYFKQKGNLYLDLCRQFYVMPDYFIGDKRGDKKNNKKQHIFIIVLSFEGWNIQFYFFTEFNSTEFNCTEVKFLQKLNTNEPQKLSLIHI